MTSQSSVPTAPAAPRKPPRCNHNVGGESQRMEGFWERPVAPMWLAIEQSNRHA